MHASGDCFLSIRVAVNRNEADPVYRELESKKVLKNVYLMERVWRLSIIPNSFFFQSIPPRRRLANYCGTYKKFIKSVSVHWAQGYST
ncbi:hypothetical protein Y032_0049g1846 [Ancylostoma ceylanicum]|uniref:Uncharacterized protein n=1 Tax=Ancylostoma ceylanicum TaxID=53326 RepID=A0A016U9B8_9BILA|nr:hypothetical protein Y032_0049g1846 [Ancylostoma ceylanicum]